MKNKKLQLDNYSTNAKLLRTTNPSMIKFIGTDSTLRFSKHSSGLYTAYFGGFINYHFYTSYIKSAVITDSKLTITTRNSIYVFLVPEKDLVLIKAPDDLINTQEAKIQAVEKKYALCFV